MTDKKVGGRIPRNPDSLRHSGVRLPPVRPEFARLLDAIASNRGGTKASHIEKALIAYAKIEEAEQAGLVE